MVLHTGLQAAMLRLGRTLILTLYTCRALMERHGRVELDLLKEPYMESHTALQGVTLPLEKIRQLLCLF